jgi:glycosyltransferase involved in cell wall biosynthesis
MKPSADAAVPAVREQGLLNCLMLGTVSPGKRQEDALTAVGQLARLGLNVRLSIVGHQVPEYMKVLHKIIDECAIRERVDFVDWVADPSPVCARGGRIVDVLSDGGIWPDNGRGDASGPAGDRDPERRYNRVDPRRRDGPAVRG